MATSHTVASVDTVHPGVSSAFCAVLELGDFLAHGSHQRDELVNLAPLWRIARERRSPAS